MPICSITALYWIVTPGAALEALYGVEAPDAVHASLLAQLAFVVLAVFVWFYGRWLLSGRVALRPFRYLQEGMGMSDAMLIWAAFDGVARGAIQPAAGAAQAIMAAIWLGVRVVFLATTAGRPEDEA